MPNITSLGYKLCSSADIPNLSQEYIQRGLNSSLYCPENKDYKIAGNYLANNYQYVSVSIVKCVGTGCKTSTEIDTLLQNIVMSVGVLSSYMDFNDYENPIKTYFDDRNSFYIVPTFSKEIRMYIKLNEADLDDDYIGYKSSNTKQFFDIERTTEDLRTLSSNITTN